MQEIVVIDGEISLENTLDGEVELEAITDLDPEVVLSTGGAVYPHYSGSYTVTPSSSVQVLDTSDKVMDDDVTVQAVTQGSATTPATIITANPSISVSSGGLITATVSKTQQVTPTVIEGYVSAGTAGNIGVSGSNTEQLSVQAAQTIHPSTSDQSIASGKYLTGAQTIKAVTVSGLSADKVLTGTTVKIGDVDDDDRIANVVGTAQQGITPTGTKQISITQNGTTTEDVTNYASAEITVNVSGGASGGLANMVNVTDSDVSFAYMLSAMKNGNTTGGTVTYTTAFANTETKIIETGLTTLHGIIFAPTAHDTKTTSSGVQSNKFVLIQLYDDEVPAKYLIFGFAGNNNGAAKPTQTLGTAYTSAPENGTITVSGGDLYFKGRYNKNASYQLLMTNIQYEWIAW